MEKEKFFEEMNKYSEEINIMFTEKQLENFYLYMNLLIEWNKNINLTAIIEPKEIILKHFIDSLTINKYIEKNESIVDMGTGAGFPGIPLKIVRDDIDVVLVDSLNKRIKFLDEVIDKLGLQNIKTVHARAEELGRMKEYREKFDNATSRAVANLATLSEYLLPLVKLNGKAICMKGSDVDEEIEIGNKAIKTLGGNIEKVDKFQLPQSDINRNIILIKKVDKTDKKYPRKPGTPSKEPIK